MAVSFREEIVESLLRCRETLNGQLITYGSDAIPISRKAIESFPTFKARPDDVYVCTYPKAGTHWALDIAIKALFEGDLDKSDRWERAAIDINVGASAYMGAAKAADGGRKVGFSLEEIAHLESPRVLNSHLWYSNLPQDARDKHCKVISVVRNPKDCWLSFYNMHVKLFGEDFPDWNAFIELVLEGKSVFGSWPDYVKSFESEAANPDVLVLQYEDMKKDLLSAVRKIAVHLGADLSEECLLKITKSCTIEATKKRSPESTFVHKGISGEWKRHFTVDQSERIDDMLERQGIKDLKTPVSWN